MGRWKAWLGASGPITARQWEWLTSNSANHSREPLNVRATDRSLTSTPRHRNSGFIRRFLTQKGRFCSVYWIYLRRFFTRGVSLRCRGPEKSRSPPLWTAVFSGSPPGLKLCCWWVCLINAVCFKTKRQRTTKKRKTDLKLICNQCPLKKSVPKRDPGVGWASFLSICISFTTKK